MRFKKVVTASYYDPNELAEEFINNGRRIVNTDKKIIVALSHKQSLFLENLYTHRRSKVVPLQYTAKGYYVDNQRIWSWILQRGTGGYDQIVAVYKYTKDEFRADEIYIRAEDIPRKQKKVVESPKLPLFE